MDKGNKSYTVNQMATRVAPLHTIGTTTIGHACVSLHFAFVKVFARLRLYVKQRERSVRMKGKSLRVQNEQETQVRP